MSGIATAIIAVVSFIFTAKAASDQRKAARAAREKAAAEADARKGFEITVENPGERLPLVYGRAKIGGVRVFHRTKHNFKYVAPNADKVFDVGPEEFSATYSFLDFNYDTDNILDFETIVVAYTVPAGLLNRDLNGSKNEFLYFQQALCHGPIEEAVEFLADESKFSNDPSLGQYGGDRYENVTAAMLSTVHYGNNVADSIFAKNLDGRQNAKFAGIAYASTVIKLNRDDPQFAGDIPGVSYFIKGRKVRKSINGVLQARAYSNNPAWCLLDYLLESSDRTFVESGNIYTYFDPGKGLLPSQINFESFENAALICDIIVKTQVPAIGPAWRPNSMAKTLSYRDLPLYECNVVIDPSKSFRDNVESILDTMGDAQLIWSQGQYKLVLSYPADNSQIAIKKTITDDDLVLGKPLVVNYPNASQRFNHAKVKFSNEELNFADDEVSWPPKLSSNTWQGVNGVRYPRGLYNGDNQFLLEYGVWDGFEDNPTLTWLFRPEVSGTYTMTFVSTHSANRRLYNHATGETTHPLNPSSNIVDNLTLVGGIVYAIEFIFANVTVASKSMGFNIVNDSRIVFSSLTPAFIDYVNIVKDSTIYDSYLAEDNGIELETSITFEGCIDKYHALAKAEEIVRKSRTSIEVTFAYNARQEYLEPGDIIVIDSSYLPFATTFYAKVEEVKLEETGICEISAKRFDSQQLAWNVDDESFGEIPEVFTGQTLPVFNVSFIARLNTFERTVGLLEWDSFDVDNVTSYEVYALYSDSFDSNGLPVFNLIGETKNSYFNVPQVDRASAIFGVKAKYGNLRKSRMVTSGDQAFLLPFDDTAKQLKLITDNNITVFTKDSNTADVRPSKITIHPEYLNLKAGTLNWYINGNIAPSTAVGLTLEILFNIVLNKYEQGPATYNIQPAELSYWAGREVFHGSLNTAFINEFIEAANLQTLNIAAVKQRIERARSSLTVMAFESSEPSFYEARFLEIGGLQIYNASVTLSYNPLPEEAGATVGAVVGGNLVNNGSVVTDVEVINSNAVFTPTYLYEFTNANNGWQAVNASFDTLLSTIILNGGGLNPQMISPVISFAGATTNLVRVRLKRLSGTGWRGKLFYETDDHGFSESFYKEIPDSSKPQYSVLEWDLTSLTAGNNDFLNSIVKKIRIDLGENADDSFQIDWIAIGYNKPASFENLGGGNLGRVDQLTPDNAANLVQVGAIRADAVDTRGLTVRDLLGNIILSAGTPLDYERVSGVTAPEANATRNENKGGWSSANFYYVKGDEVTFDGSTFTAKIAHFSALANSPPVLPSTENDFWQLRAARGDEGVTFNVVIESTNGLVFKPGQTTNTLLIAKVFRNGLEVTNEIPESKFRWRRMSFYDRQPPDDDATWNADYASGFKQISITITDVEQRATYHCDILE